MPGFTNKWAWSLAIGLIALLGLALILKGLQSSEATTIILVRHAEKESSGKDPSLTAEGVARAEDLKQLLQNVKLNAVYSTDYQRTRLTALPTADLHGLDIQLYDAKMLETFKQEILNTRQGQKILVVGHSNSTPNLINLLTGENIYQQIPESDYDNLYIVTVIESAKAETLNIKYGK